VAARTGDIDASWTRAAGVLLVVYARRVSSPITKVSVAFDKAVALRVYPALARAGLHGKSKRLWWERHEDGSWLVLELQISTGTTATVLGFTINVHVWPPGTWDRLRASHESYAAADVPLVGTAPFSQRPATVAAERWPWPDIREIDRSADFDLVADELAQAMLACLQWGREHSDVEGALRTMTMPFGLRDFWAIVMLRAEVPQHPQLVSLVDQFTRRWRDDPRPITMRDEVVRWRGEAGLEPLERLPRYWHVAMQPWAKEEHGWPGAAFKVGVKSDFYLADGTRTSEPPPDWPNPGRESR
jgi:hypothetical protein